jgi:hypothetical protein
MIMIMMIMIMMIIIMIVMMMVMMMYYCFSNHITSLLYVWSKVHYSDKDDTIGSQKRSVGRPSYSHMLCYYKHSLTGSSTSSSSSSSRSSRSSRSSSSSSSRGNDHHESGNPIGDVDATINEVGDNDGIRIPPLTTASPSAPSAPLSRVPASAALSSVYKSDLFAVPDIFYRCDDNDDDRWWG